jgi:hypothetical protein
MNSKLPFGTVRVSLSGAPPGRQSLLRCGGDLWTVGLPARICCSPPIRLRVLVLAVGTGVVVDDGRKQARKLTFVTDTEKPLAQAVFHG